jgi:hypothetical protein
MLSLLIRFSFASPKEKLQKKRSLAKMLPHARPAARPLSPDAIAHPTL